MAEKSTISYFALNSDPASNMFGSFIPVTICTSCQKQDQCKMCIQLQTENMILQRQLKSLRFDNYNLREELWNKSHNTIGIKYLKAPHYEEDEIYDPIPYPIPLPSRWEEEVLAMNAKIDQ